MTLRQVALCILENMNIHEAARQPFLVLIGTERLDQPARRYAHYDFDDEMSDLIKRFSVEPEPDTGSAGVEFLKAFQNRVYYFH